MPYTCESSGVLDGHSPFCNLRRGHDSAPRLNKVVVGLPERLEKRDSALRDLETLHKRLREIYGMRGQYSDEYTLDLIGQELGLEKKPLD